MGAGRALLAAQRNGHLQYVAREDAALACAQWLCRSQSAAHRERAVVQDFGPLGTLQRKHVRHSRRRAGLWREADELPMAYGHLRLEAPQLSRVAAAAGRTKRAASQRKHGRA